MGYVVRGISKNARLICVDATEVVQKAQDIHNCSATAIAAFGRMLAAGLMMGTDLKGENDILTLRTNSNGPLNNIVVTADMYGDIKGYLSNPGADTAPLRPGKLNVGAIIGQGHLNVIRDMGLKDPYVGVSELVSGEIGEDLAYYFYNSEQVPSVVGVGVLVNPDLSIKYAGGYIIQVMPNADEKFIDKLEQQLQIIRPVTEMFEAGITPEEVFEELFFDLEKVEVISKRNVQYKCNCKKDKFYKALITLNKSELKDLFEKEGSIETECHFCGKKYEFIEEDFNEILK